MTNSIKPFLFNNLNIASLIYVGFAQALLAVVVFFRLIVHNLQQVQARSFLVKYFFDLIHTFFRCETVENSSIKL